MPEGYTHVRTAQKAAHAIHYKLQCPAAFAAGANGPDSFFCYEVWKKGQNRTYNLPLLGNRMHEDKTGAFLLALPLAALFSRFFGMRGLWFSFVTAEALTLFIAAAMLRRFAANFQREH